MAKASFGRVIKKEDAVAAEPSVIYKDRPIFIDRDVPVEVIKYVDVAAAPQPPITIEKVVYVDKIVEVIKEVPSAPIHIKVPVFIDKPIEVIKEKIVEIEVPVQVAIEKIVHRVPAWVVGVLASETVLLVMLLAHKLLS